jgi:type IV secretion system protein VirB8
VSQDKTLQGYLREAQSWDQDRVAMNARSARIAWRVAFGACLALIASLLALLLLLPLKTVEPFLVRVDNRTGIVDVVPVYAGQAPIDEAVTRYFLSHYVAVCERFNYYTAESDYEECGAFHTPARNQQWSTLWAVNNPSSPLNIHKHGSSVRVQVESLTFFKRANGNNDLEQVRYMKAERQGSAPERVSHWIAMIQYAYATPAKDAKIRRWNPLGFKIVEFKSEPEVKTPGAAPTGNTNNTEASVGANGVLR